MIQSEDESQVEKQKRFENGRKAEAGFMSLAAARGWQVERTGVEQGRTQVEIEALHGRDKRGDDAAKQAVNAPDFRVTDRGSKRWVEVKWRKVISVDCLTELRRLRAAGDEVYVAIPIFDEWWIMSIDDLSITTTEPKTYQRGGSGKPFFVFSPINSKPSKLPK